MLSHISIRPMIASTAPTTRLFFCRNSTCPSISLMKGELVARTTPIRDMKKPTGSRNWPRALMTIYYAVHPG